MIFEQLLQKVEHHFKKQLPFVLYRKPASNRVEAFFQKNDDISVADYTKDGFVFAPFLLERNTIFFPKENCEYCEAFYKQETQESGINTEIEENKNQKNIHTQLIDKAIDFIKKSEVSKIVVSRKEKIPLLNTNLLSIYQKMLYLYSSAFVYMWHHPKIGTWLGATPERLLTTNQNEFYTMALAGTQLYHKNKKTIWGEKEIFEQQIVTDDIVQNLKPLVNCIKYSKPTTVRAGNLVHLKTDILAEISKLSLKKIIERLHPTPAVCGFPTSEARKFIVENENYDREYYSGFLGELNLNHKTELFVNLRCMQIKDKNAYLYIGGGITAESISEKEWEETVYKSQIIKNVL